MYTQEWQVFQSDRSILPMALSERRRQAVERIMVNHMESSRKLSLKRDNAKLRKNRSIKKSIKSTNRKILMEYLEESSLHGMQYLSNLRMRPSIVGKVFWILVMIFSLAFLCWMIKTIWKRYDDSPVLSVVDTFHAPIFTIPFPAVTICPAIAPLAERRKKLLERLRLPKGINDTTAWFLVKYVTAFSDEQVGDGKIHVKNLRALLNFNNITLLEVMRYLRPCEDMVESCWWDGQKKNCSEFLRTSYATEGICCSFNYFLEDYIHNDKNVESIQYLRSAKFGPMSGFAITLHPKLFEDDEVNGLSVRYAANSVGIFVYCHHPMEYLGSIANKYLLQAGQELGVGIIPQINLKLSSYTERNKHGKLRPQCVKDNDIKLKYFPKYLYNNCFVDCSIQVSLDLCGCVPYYYEPMAIKHSLKICNYEDMICLYNNADYIRITDKSTAENFTCNCFTPCREIHYDMFSTLGLLNRHESNTWFVHKNLSESQAILKVFWNCEIVTVTNVIPVANELYLLASLGGIFSLFVGCSFVSIAEILYFIGLYFQSYCNSKKSK